MPFTIFILAFAMLFSDDVWAVYGIMVDAKNAPINRRSPTSTQELGTVVMPTASFEPPSTAAPHSKTTDPPLSLDTTLDTTYGTLRPSTTYRSLGTTAVPSSHPPPVPPAKATHALTTGAKIGIAVTVGLLGIALALVLLESCYMRRKRRERALLRAVEEVERGTDKGSEERIVLESSVSIVFDEDINEEDQRGRQGMSLPRRN